MDLSLQFEDNNTGHNDLILRFAGQEWVADSYYLALDGGVSPQQEDSDKIRAVLRCLLEQWRVAIEAMPDGGTINLPYDFSDQYTGWLRCQRSGNMLGVCRGWAEVEGYSFYPSEIGEHLINLPGFHADGPSAQLTVAEVLDAVQESLAKIT